GADVRERGVDELVGEVTENEWNLEPLHEQRRELPRHQAAADDAHLLDRARLYFRHADTSLLAPLDEVEGVDRVLRLRRGQQVRDRVLLGAVALLERPLRGALDQVE